MHVQSRGNEGLLLDINVDVDPNFPWVMGQIRWTIF